MKPSDNYTPMPGERNAEIERILESHPEQVARAQWIWDKAILDREKVEALAYAQYKGEAEANGVKRTADDLKALVRSDEKRYQAVLKEITAKAKYTKLNEELMAAKKFASLRTAF